MDASDLLFVKTRLTEKDREDLHEVTEGECKKLPGTCPHTICRFHLFERNRPGVVLDEPCMFKIVEDRGEHTLEEVANFMGMTRERIRQIQEKALNKIFTKTTNDEIREQSPDQPLSVRVVKWHFYRKAAG